MNSKVKVLANEAGSVVVVSENNPNYGHIRVSQDRVLFDEKGFLRKKTIYALIAGEVEDLRSLGWNSGKELPGKIAIKESLTPFNAKDPERDFKKAGTTNVVCTLDDQPIYRKTVYTPNGEAPDATVEHNNTDAIRAAYAVQKEEATEELDA